MSFSTGAKRYVACLCLFTAMLLLTVNSTTFAALQSADAPALGQTVVSEDGVYTVDYPDGFVTKTATNLIAIGSSDKAMSEALQAKPVLSSGSVAFEIEYFPPGDTSSSGLDASDPQVLIKSAIKATKMTFGDIKPFSLDKLEGSRAELQESTVNGVLLTFYVDKTVFLVIQLNAPGETGQFEDTLNAIVQTIRPSKGPNLNTSDATPVVASIDGVKLGKTFTSTDLQVLVDYPDGWVVEGGSNNLVNLGSSKDALDQVAHQSKPKLTSGQVVIQLVYGFPGKPFPLGLDASSSQNMLAGILKNLPWKAGDIQPLKLGDDDAARVDITDPNLSGVFVAVTGGKVPVLAGIFTAPGESSTVEPILDAIVLSVRLNDGSTPVAIPEPSPVTLGKTFTSADQQVSLDYPDGWVVDSNTTTPNILSLGSTQAAIDQAAKKKLASGQAVVDIFYGIPGMPLPIGLDPIPDHMISRLLRVFVLKGGDTQPLKLGEYNALRADFTDLNQNSGVMVAVIKGNVAVLGVIFTASGEAHDVEPILEAIVSSIRLNDGSAPATTPEPQATKTAPTTSSSDVTLDKTFTSSDKSLTVSYPSDWETQSTATYQVSIGNSAEALKAVSSQGNLTLTSGNVVAQFTYVPSGQESGLDVSGDPSKLLTSLTANVPANNKLGDIETGTLGDFDVAHRTLTSDGFEAIVYAFFIGKKPVYIVAAAAPGEMAQSQSTIEAMIASVQVNPPAK